MLIEKIKGFYRTFKIEKFIWRIERTNLKAILQLNSNQLFYYLLGYLHFLL
jgi:hypothetical protein